jgi:outer membrane protein OmpA-like peptidoglycan-associated protein
MKKLNRRSRRIGVPAGTALLVAGCGLASIGGGAAAQRTGPAVTITQASKPAALLMLLAGSASGPTVSGLVHSTTRASEDLTILAAGTSAKTIVAADSPAPARIVIPGPPLAPTGGQTSYQAAQHARRLAAWQAERAAAVKAVAAETQGRMSAWLSGLAIPQQLSRLSDRSAAQGSLAAETAIAASAMAGLQAESGNAFGSRRVIVLFADSLAGSLPPGELTGDDVIVSIPYLPTASAASAAQAELLGAGAAEAAVIGPEVTGGALTALVSAGLSQGVGGDSVSTPVLFGNGSAALDTTASSQLTRLLTGLRKPGATAVINGYASTPGSARANYLLSYQRAAQVAGFLEAHGVPASALIIVGHGATDQFGAGSPDANRRVLVVSEQSASPS